MSHEPDPLLVLAYDEYLSALFPQGGCALDLAGGVGRHAIWLAQRGWSSELVDISDAGLAIARERAREAGVPLAMREFDVASGMPEEFAGAFDVVMTFFYLERSRMHDIAALLAPGGLLIYKTYTELHADVGSGGPKHPMHLLKPNELLRAFAEFEVLYYRETVKERGVAEMIARRPR